MPESNMLLTDEFIYFWYTQRENIQTSNTAPLYQQKV